MKRLAAFVAVCALLALPGLAVASPTLPLSHSGRWITDARGRVVIVHGTNMVYKLPPYYPAAIGFGADDAAFLHSIDFDAVRVGVIWAAVEPQPGSYDEAYIAHIKQTVDMLGRHGIVSMLDFHQDMLNEQFQGEGAPSWAIQSGGLPNPMLGFPGNYLANPALEHALDAFFQNAPGPGGVGLQDRFAGAWTHVASAFRNDPNVLGYELFNEPFPGTLWEQCAVPTGCPGFDGELTAFYQRVIHAIRAVDSRTLIFYEPQVLFNEGIATNLGPIGDAETGFAFHDYCLSEPQTGATGCDPFDNLVFSNAIARATSTGAALIETEFGATTDVPYLDDMVARGDSDMVPWLEWAYCGCNDPTTTGPGAKQAIVIDPSKSPSGSNLVLPTLGALVEPYPQLIAGTPSAWGFDRTTGTFTLRYSTARVDGRGSFPSFSVSEVAVPQFVYVHGYAAVVHGGAIVSPPGAGVLYVAACPGYGTVSVTVTPTGKSSGSCQAISVTWRRHHHRRRHHR